MSCYKKGNEQEELLRSKGLIKDKVVVNFSGGKDSTAMLLRMIELGEHIDVIQFADTNFEFPLLYEYIKKIETIINRPIQILTPDKSFDDWRFGKLTRGKHKGDIRGFPQVVTPCYWMRESKFKSLQKFAKENQDAVFCIGIASDEKQRVQKATNLRYPLIEWGWSEEDCIDYLQRKGLMNGLYKDFSRLGCYMCPKQSTFSKYQLYTNYPELWEKLKVFEKENIRDTGRSIFIKPVSYFEDNFKQGKIPKDRSKICFECKGIRESFTE